MSSISIFDTVKNFEEQFKSHQPAAMLAQVQGKEGAFKRNSDAKKKIQDIYQKAQDSIAAWTEKPEGRLAGLKNKVRNFLLNAPTYDSDAFEKASFFQKPLMWLGKKVHNLGDKISPAPEKVSASEPYKFGQHDEAEMANLEKKANIVKTLAKTALIAGGILLAGGIVAPLALATLLMSLPESVALGVVIGCTVLGVAGVASAVASPIIKNSKPVNEYEAEMDGDFHRFVNEFVQKQDGGFNLSRKEIQNGKIHEIYKEWKDSLEDLLSAKNLKKMEEERQKLTS